MHGAMYVEGMQDGDGDWIAAARNVVGKDCLITASFDLHGSLSKRTIDNLDMLAAYRTAPHIDYIETTQRACDMLVHCLDQHIRPTMVWAPIPVLMPGERSSTLYEPAKRLWAQLAGMNAEPGVLDASLLVGYVWADEPRATASAVMTGTKPDVLKKDCVVARAAVLGCTQRVSIRRAYGHSCGVCGTSTATQYQARGFVGFRRQSYRRGIRRPCGCAG